MCSIAIVCRKSQEIRREASSGSWVSQIQIFAFCTLVPIFICIFLQLHFCSVTFFFLFNLLKALTGNVADLIFQASYSLQAADTI